MSLTLLALGFLLVLVAAYNLYGGWVARQFKLDDSRRTPAHEVNDGVDFVPTRPFYLFGQHFSAIAAAGPIAGPILACQAFGWLPCLLWIGFGVVLIGAVHDFASLAASVRHGATSVAEITREHLGTKAGRAMMAFIWIALIYVIVAFADITAGTFVAGSEELHATAVAFNPGGAVAAASVLYLALSLVLGLVQKYLNPPLWLVTVIFVPAAFALSWAGTLMSNTFVLSHKGWGLLILAYCCVASVVPVWTLLQPRGYLGGFILYAAIALGIIGVFFGGYEIQQPAFKGWTVPGMTGMLFPFLFVTIACGACSGFHGLVCSGTTSKQVERESHIKPVGYGAMLAEGFVALIALVTIMILAPSEIKPNTAAGTIYGERHREVFDAPAVRRRGESGGRHDLRRDGLLDLRLRHARRLHASRPLHRAGAFRLAFARGRARGDASDGGAARLLHRVRAAQLVVEVLDALRRVEPTARGADAADHHGLALPGAQAHRLHARPDGLRARHHALGALDDGRREPARDEGASTSNSSTPSPRPRSSCSRSTSP